MAPLVRFQGIVAETDSMLVSRWHPGVGIDVHPGFSFACSETACQDGNTVRSSSYFSQLLAETGIDHETEAGGVRVVEGRFQSGDSDRTDDWRVLGAWLDHSAVILEHQFNRGDYPQDWYQSGAFGRPSGTLVPVEGSAIWQGVMIGADKVTNDRYAGTANLAAAFAAEFRYGAMDLSFTATANVATGEARDDILFADVDIQSQNDHGRFAGWTGGTFQEAPIYVEGEMFGPDHAEAAGVFGYNELVGAFAAKRQ